MKAAVRFPIARRAPRAASVRARAQAGRPRVGGPPPASLPPLPPDGTRDRLEQMRSAQALVRLLDGAVLPLCEPRCSSVPTDCCGAAVERVEEALATWLNDLAPWLPSELVVPPEGDASYGRRALHVDKLGRYAAVVMTWSPGQETAIHDHGDMWCVEGVYMGRVVEESFELEPGSERAGRVRLRASGRKESGIGDADGMLPPRDIHRIKNVGGKQAVTIHVYGGHLTRCHTFSPLGGGEYTKDPKSLLFTHDISWYEGGESLDSVPGPRLPQGLT